MSQVAKLMGKTAGLARNTGAKTADGLLAAGRQAGKLLYVPSKLRSIAAPQTEKEPQGECDLETECLRCRIETLYTRIGERICHSPLVDRAGLSADSQIEAILSTVRDLEIEMTYLQQRDQDLTEMSHSPDRQESPTAAGQTELPAEESGAGKSAPSPAPEKRQAPPTGTWPQEV